MKSLTIAREIGDRLGEGQSLGNLGITYHSLGEYQQAIEFHELHLAIAREIGNRLGEADALRNKGLALDKLDDRAQAIVNIKSALEIYEMIKAPDVDKVRDQLAKWQNQSPDN